MEESQVTNGCGEGEAVPFERHRNAGVRSRKREETVCLGSLDHTVTFLVSLSRHFVHSNAELYKETLVGLLRPTSLTVEVFCLLSHLVHTLILADANLLDARCQAG